MNRYIFNSSLQRRNSIQRYPYNFIFAVQKKLKVGQIAARTFRSNMKHVNSKLRNNNDYKPNKYCIQTVKFILQAAKPIIGSQDFLTGINIQINMQFITLIPQFQSKFPKYWKRPKLTNALNALRDRLAKRIDVFRRCEENTTKTSEDSVTNEEKYEIISHANDSLNTLKKHWNKELSVGNETYAKSLTDLLRLREKLLIDRTTMLISWFEVQMEKLKSDNQLMQISEIRKKQENLLLHMHKERQYINRLLLLHEQKTNIFPTKTNAEPTKSVDNSKLCLRRFHDDYYSLIPDHSRKELSIKFSSKANNCPHNALNYVMRTYLLDQPKGNIGYLNLCQWILKRKFHKDSKLWALFPQNKDQLHIIGNECKSVMGNESQSQTENAENQIVIESISSQSAERTNNESTLNSTESLCNTLDAIPFDQTIEVQDKLCEVPQTVELAQLEVLPIANKLLTSSTEIESSTLERLNEDINLEEHKKVDSSNKPVNVLKDSGNLLLKRFESYLKCDARSNCDHIEKVIIYELYNEDLHWDNMYAITGEVLEALTDELIIQHIKNIVKCIIPE